MSKVLMTSAAMAVALAVSASAQLLRADENGIVSTLRGIASGQFTYSAVCATGFYAPTLSDLGRPKPGDTMAFILDSDVPPKGEKVLEKYRYRVEMTAPPSPKSPASCNGVAAGGSAATFAITARPMPGYGGKSFRIDDKGTLTEIK